jgi:serine/threonine protein kinase
MSERDIFLAVIDLPDERSRSAYLDAACGGDPALRRRIESLIQSHDSADSFLDAPAVSPNIGNSITQELAWTSDTDQASDDISRKPVEAVIEPLSFLSPPQRRDSLGRLAHYDVLQILGEGGFATVFRAFDDVLQRVVAMKVMSLQLAATSPARKRFLREARSSAKIRHENVVQIYAVQEQPLPYLVMEFIPGETLQQRLDRTGPLDVRETLHIGRQIAEGLAAAHANGLIHRDIKPGNILVEGGPKPCVKLTDFGLARAADDASMTKSGTIAGTPMYMAPEQAEGETLDQRADLFSFGSVLYQMVTGRPPFRASSTLGVLKRVAEDDPRSIREIIPETPQWLCDIIGKLHQKNPNDRIQTAREVADLFADCEEQLKASSRITNPPAFPSRKTASSQRRWWIATAILASLLVLAAALLAPRFFSADPMLKTDNPAASKAPHAPAQFAQRFDPPQPATRSEVKPPQAKEGSFEQRIAALPAIEKVEEFRKEIQRLNPEFGGSVIPMIEHNEVTSLEFFTDRISDISTVRAFPRLSNLNCRGHTTRGWISDLTPLKGLPLQKLTCSVTAITDLSPLKGMPLIHLHVDNSFVSDLSPLKGMPLKVLNCSYTQVSDLSALSGMSLSILWCNNTGIADLSPLKGMPLEWITFHSTKVTDISPLKGMPLSQIYLDYNPERDREVLRSLTTLQRINDKAADVFWQENDRK